MSPSDGIEATKKFRQREKEKEAATWCRRSCTSATGCVGILLADDSASTSSKSGSEKQVEIDTVYAESMERNKQENENSAASFQLRPGLPSGERADTRQAGRRLLIIGMSANSDSETRRLATEAGMDHVLEKPFVLADFMKLLVQLQQQQAHSRSSVSVCASIPSSMTPLSTSLNGEISTGTVPNAY